MADVPIPPELVQDPWEKNVPGLGLGRDPERTPMQWDASPNAGFTTGEPWLPIAADYRVMNVAAEAADPRSMLSLHRALIALRRAEAALSVGEHVPVSASGDVLAYERRHAGRRVLVALNMGSSPRELDDVPADARVLLSTYLDRGGETVGGTIRLRADEGLIVGLG